MAIEGFNYKEFAQNLTQQAVELVPQEFNDLEKQYVVNTLLNFSTMAGEALYNDTESNFNAEQATMITQIIAEWSFHKSVDLIKSKIPQEYWDSVMQKIAFTIFEIAKQTFKQGLPQDQILSLIEHHVKKAYLGAIAELKDKGFIDEDLMEQASRQSNIDAMMQQMSAEQQAEQTAQAQDIAQPQNQVQNSQNSGKVNTNPQQQIVSSKILKLATVALLFKKMQQEKVQTILDKFNPDDAQMIIKYMNVANLEERMDLNNALKCLKEIKTNLPQKSILGPSKIMSKIQKVTKLTDKQHLETLLEHERLNVKRFVFNAIEGNYYELPPKVANVIATHIEDSV